MKVATAAVWLLLASQAAAEEITRAKYELPVERYGHFALGRPHEYARLTAFTEAGRSYSLVLPEHEVFEDLEPRRVRLAPDEPIEILAIVSGRESGSRLVTIRLDAGQLAVSAQSAPIGTPMRWLNIVGAADLDGDGAAEIAAVTTPHIGGTLRVYRRRGAVLLEVASLPGFSNHVYGSAELGLSAAVAAVSRLVVPDASRRSLRVIALQEGRLIETHRCPLAEPLIRPTDFAGCAAARSPGG